jgi:glutaredoxin
MVKEFLKRRNVEFVEFNVEDDEERWREALSKTGGLDVVPVVDVGGKVVFGRFTSDFERALTDALADV